MHQLDAFEGLVSSSMSARAITTSLGVALALRLIDRFEQPLAALPDPHLLCAPLLRDSQGWHWPSVLLGLVLGALLYPLCELVLGYRYWVLRSILDQQAGIGGAGPRTLHRFLDLPLHGRSDHSAQARGA